MPNMIETVIAMLATTSIGAVWSSCSPDFGIKGVLDRFGQIKPKVLFTANGYYYNGKTFDSIERVEGIINDLPSIQNVIVVPNTDKEIDIRTIPNSVYWDNFISQKSGLTINFEYVEPDHPLYIMFTSGTTGLPKCMVQSTAGVLINQLKEHFLHTDVTRDDTVFYFTTSGWMMWNWLVCSLALGATVVLFDGSPFYPDGNVLWQMAQDEQITVFGTSAKYLDELEKRGHKPGSNFDLSKLKAVLSTGSPLSVESFEFVYREIKKDLQLSSISGGSDINGCWCLGSPISPVYAGEIQKRGLGMKMEIFDEYGKPVKQQKGELVITAPAPPMPLHFWNDPDGQRYHNAYFDVYPGVWRHGDFAEITEHNGVIMYGRSDATLNPGGVRIGTAEIYRQVENIGEIEDSLVIGQDWQNDVRIILFIKLKPNTEYEKGGNCSLEYHSRQTSY
jgi:acetoacetyl-CoA synthetase